MMEFGIFGLIVFIIGIIGWILNIVKLIQCAGGAVSGMFIIRIIGIFVAPLGCIMGFIGNGVVSNPAQQSGHINSQQPQFINSQQHAVTRQKTAKFCNGCGDTLESGVAFCCNCGKQIAA